ncbi:putative pectinesterase 15 [Bidens hawaiensis]|uniref:putative pectinesterase 15 n=1 Tax=Bidens hawaiensis TaxID=980011 RepID=UPI004049E1D6
MNTKSDTLFWLSAVAVVLLSIFISFYTQDSNITKFENQTLTRSYWFLACDETKWKSPLVAKYGVGLTLTVDQKGCGKFNSIQKAVDAVSDNAPKPTLIIVDSGTYWEKVVVANTKSNLIIQGQGYTNTFIVWDDTAANSNGTYYSYPVGVFAAKFIAHDISFKIIDKLVL